MGNIAINGTNFNTSVAAKSEAEFVEDQLNALPAEFFGRAPNKEQRLKETYQMIKAEYDKEQAKEQAKADKSTEKAQAKAEPIPEPQPDPVPDLSKKSK